MKFKPKVPSRDTFTSYLQGNFYAAELHFLQLISHVSNFKGINYKEVTDKH